MLGLYNQNSQEIEIIIKLFSSSSQMLQQNKSVFPCQAFSCLSNEVRRNDQLPNSLTYQSQPTHGAIKKPTRTQNLQKVDSLGPFLVRPCLIFVSKQVYRSLIAL